MGESVFFVQIIDNSSFTSSLCARDTDDNHVTSKKDKTDQAKSVYLF